MAFLGELLIPSSFLFRTHSENDSSFFFFFSFSPGGIPSNQKSTQLWTGENHSTNNEDFFMIYFLHKINKLFIFQSEV